MPITVDLSQTIMASCIVQLANDLKVSTPEQSIKLIKHMTFTTLLSYKKKYGKEFGNMIIACDGRDYWRKQYFPYYKGHRKHAREASTLDFDVVFEAIAQIKSDIVEYFPWKLIEVEHAEADDVIAVICKYHSENELIQVGVFDEEPQPCLILSSDKDFQQLQKYRNVTQYSYLQKKWVKPEGSPLAYLRQHTLYGDDGDNIPNALTSEAWAKARADGVKPERQKSITADFKKKVIEWGETALPPEVLDRWKQNSVLVNFDYIPEDLQKKITDTYTQYQSKGSKARLMTYFVKNKMTKLFEQLNDF